jgi:predicted esterase
MSHRVYGVIVGVALLAPAGCGAQRNLGAEHRTSLRGTLQTLSEEAGDPLFRLHFRSIIEVIEAGDRGSSRDARNINKLWKAFENVSGPGSPRLRESYLKRAQQLIVSWVSPTDGQVSFAWLRLPAGWDPKPEYPLYLQLHGLWDVAADRLDYLTHPFLKPATSPAFEDGYLVSPWGRGNQWYRGSAEVDVWECIAAIKKLVRVDLSRQYLCGHSMGSYGAWHIALSSADTWAALGIHAGALGYNGQRELNSDAAGVLRAVPTYFVVGNSDGLFEVNQIAYQLLRSAGNRNVAFVMFPGGHDYRLEDVEKMYLWMKKFDRDDRPAASAE